MSNSTTCNSVITSSVLTSTGGPGGPYLTTNGTGALYNGTLIYNNSSGTNNLGKVKYYILGEYVTVDGYSDIQTALAISTLNILGKPFYEQLQMNGIKFNSKIEEYLKVKFRDITINTILDNDK
jgi:hypothetical protein